MNGLALNANTLQLLLARSNAVKHAANVGAGGSRHIQHFVGFGGYYFFAFENSFNPVGGLSGFRRVISFIFGHFPPRKSNFVK